MRDPQPRPSAGVFLAGFCLMVAGYLLRLYATLVEDDGLTVLGWVGLLSGLVGLLVAAWRFLDAFDKAALRLWRASAREEGEEVPAVASDPAVTTREDDPVPEADEDTVRPGRDAGPPG
ncbi:MAG: hypothetical protein QM779_14215 [Propionicimonas sp.]|uniref:hypothetical protein n=1 Tax=Propionicimonas sp. TaxID=1955623 RepID=UPI003D13DCF3